MPNMSVTEVNDMQAAVSALRMAIVSGTLEVTYDGRTVRYRSLAELRAALRYAEDLVSGTAAASRRPTFAAARFSKGL